MRRLALLRSIGTYTLLGFVPVATNLVVVPIYLRHLSVEEYGLVGLANVAYTFTLLVTGLGLPDAYGRFYFEKHNAGREGGGRLLGTVLAGVTLSTALAAILALACGPRLYELAWPSLAFQPYGWWIAVSVGGAMLQQLAFLAFRNAENLRMAALASLLPFAGGTIGTYVAVASLDGGAEGAISGRALGYLAGALPALVVLASSLPLRFRVSQLRELLEYGVPIVVYSLLNHLLFLGDRLIFERWTDLETLAVYVLAVTIISPADILANAVSPAIVPRIYRGWSAGDARVDQELQRIYEGLFAIQVVLLCIALTCAGPVVTWLGSEEYSASLPYLPFLAFAHLFRVRYLYFSMPLFFHKRTRFLPLMTLTSIGLGLAGAYAGFRWIGPVGITVGVIAWKFSQQAIAHVFVVRTGLMRAAGMPRSTMLSGLFLAYVAASYATDSTPAVLWGGAAVLTAASAFALARVLATPGALPAHRGPA
ncbi:lipopolysaccharide biosynthesis protein [Sandaracinus amylolyticus]|uniref:lipopolysaccharide biosynthesis protein n=1 Tax=Sandaracinus amylolyticus TaxID=927083 RepID=UPI001F29404C|nr:lipopolysaccharide biosynthesis protein [Sandaracinus amylolyticus]UJR80409.1 Polysaccharide biosynthesis protein [Sandaracinus amylolyticus]